MADPSAPTATTPDAAAAAAADVADGPPLAPSPQPHPQQQQQQEQPPTTTAAEPEGDDAAEAATPPPASAAAAAAAAAGESASPAVAASEPTPTPTSATSPPPSIPPHSDESFLSRMRQPAAAPLAFEFKAFLATFRSQTRPISEQRKAINRFIEAAFAQTLENPVFANVSSEEELEVIREGWEKLVMVKVYEMVFGAPGTDEKKMTNHLNNKMAAFSWVTERHFDLNFELGEGLKHVQEELLKIDSFRCPKDKLTILQNVLQVIVDLINRHDVANNDSLLPILILVIIRAKPPSFISHLNFILRFRAKSELSKGPVQYCMTTMMSAVSFIYNMTLSSLTLTDAELEKYEKTLQPQHRSSLPRSTPAAAKPKTPTPTNSTISSISSSSVSIPATAAAAASITTAATAINGLATTVFSTTFKALGDSVAVIRTAAETAAGTVDGFTQGLMERFREDGSNLPSTPPSEAGKPSESSLAGASPWEVGSRARSGVVVATASGPNKFQLHPPTPPPRTPSPINAPLNLEAKPSAAVNIPNGAGARRPSRSGLPPPVSIANQAAPSSSPASSFAARMFGNSPTTPSSLLASPTIAAAPRLLPTPVTEASVGGGRDSASSTSDRFSAVQSDTRARFEAALSDAERGVLEDYELQLALALSLSEQEKAKERQEEVAVGMLIDVGDAEERQGAGANGDDKVLSEPPPTGAENAEEPSDAPAKANGSSLLD
ncbi:hypothetical protein DFJ73DRAFT_799733 [Zopfochytrium polystomum]|nr:hypothetical protein DFJ73DRAFT_799733 [Zopfochytrium polystomum]